MTVPIVLACFAGVLVGVSRQLNGRLSVSTSPLVASFWNHIIGFALLTAFGLAAGRLIPSGLADIPWHAYLGGPIGVLFVAAGSWVVARIGAAYTAFLVVGGQMVSGVALDLVSATSPSLWASALGVALILGGLAVTQGRR